MSSSYTKLFVHFVWATRLREPLITDAIAPRVHGYIASRCESLGCVPLAVGGVADHVHALIWMSPELGVAQFARESEVEIVRLYVDRQASHHALGTLVDEWERDTAPSGA